MYTIVIRQKYEKGYTVTNVLYADQFGILDEDYIKTSFYAQQISGTLQNDYFKKYYENRAQWEDSDTFNDLEEKDYKEGAFKLENSFPLDLFAETEEFSYNKIIARIFSEAAQEDNIYPQLKAEDLP
jgi:hypothetical protein